MKAMFLKVMIMKDKRVKLMNEILNGIKVFKLYAWETSLQQQVMKFRQLEIKSIKQTAYYSAVITFSFTSAPFFVSSLYQYAVYTIYKINYLVQIYQVHQPNLTKILENLVQLVT